MPIPVATKNAALNAETVTQMGLHTAWPGPTGSLAEISGGSPAYARKTITLPTASGGSRVLSSATVFDVPPTTVRWVSLWNGSTFVIALANGGATPKNFMAVPATGYMTSTAHGYVAGQPVVFFNGTPPGGLVEGTVYYVADVQTNAFTVAATVGGTALPLTAASSFGCVVAAIVEDVYAAQSTHQINSLTLAIPD